MKRAALLACFCLIGALSVHLLTGSPDPQLSKLNPLKKTSLVDKIFKADPPVTTGPDDAVTGVPFLDDFRPRVFRSMVRQPRGPKQQFLLSRPGLYAYEARTYCLSAGARGPGSRSAPLYAPLKGKWAGIIENILDRSTEHPEISQRDTQVLIWAVLAKTKIDDLPPPVLRTARVLLSPKEIKTINGGALGVVQDQLLKEGLSRLPEPARKVLEAEAKLRRMFSRGETSYERIEEVAVLAGADLPGTGSRDVPRGRWSFHPGGYFVRYFPSKYSKTRVEVSYPPSFMVDRDSKGRIIRLSDETGRRVEADYDDSVEALTLEGDPGVRGYAFRRIRFVSRTPAESGGAFEYAFDWESPGWVLVGAPAGSSSRHEGTGRFADAAGRIRWAREHMSELEILKKALGAFRSDRLSDAMDIGNFTVALQAVVSGSPSKPPPRAVDGLDFIKVAWQDAVSKALGTGGAANASGGGLSLSGLLWAASQEDQGAGGGAGAGDEGEQPLAISNQGDDPAEGDCGPGNVTRAQGDVKINGQSAGTGSRSFSQGDIIETGGKSRVEIQWGGATIRVGSNSRVTLPDPCAPAAGTSTFKLVTGRLMAALGGNKGGFRIQGPTCATGVRGSPLPAPEPMMIASLSGEIPRSWMGRLQSSERNDLLFSEKEIREADLVLYMELSLENESFMVEAVKGPIMLLDSHGNSRILETGGILRKSLNPAHGELKEVMVVMEPR